MFRVRLQKTRLRNQGLSKVFLPTSIGVPNPLWGLKLVLLKSKKISFTILRCSWPKCHLCLKKEVERSWWCREPLHLTLFLLHLHDVDKGGLRCCPIFDRCNTGKSLVAQKFTFSQVRALNALLRKPAWLGKKPDQGPQPSSTLEALCYTPMGSLSCQQILHLLPNSQVLTPGFGTR